MGPSRTSRTDEAAERCRLHGRRPLSLEAARDGAFVHLNFAQNNANLLRKHAQNDAFGHPNMLYTWCNMQASQRLATVIGSTAFEDLQRGLHFADEELLLVPDEMPIGGVVGEFVEDDMVRDAFDLEDE